MEDVSSASPEGVAAMGGENSYHVRVMWVQSDITVVPFLGYFKALAEIQGHICIQY